jgi:transcriptional regulator with XRE-family HTH domain
MLEQPHFGSRLKKLRLELGLSQAELAGEGMSTGYLSRLESGERRPSRRVVDHLASQLNVDPSVFERPLAPPLSQVLAAIASAPDSINTAGTLASALRDDEHGDPAARWQALWLICLIHNRHGDYRTAATWLVELVELSKQLAAPELCTRAYTQQARCLRSLGELQSAQRAADEALAIARHGQGSPDDLVSALMVQISIRAESGALHAAATDAAQLEQELEHVSPARAAEALWTCATVYTRQGHYKEATSRLQTALDLLDSRGDLSLWARLRLAAAATALQSSPPQVTSARQWLQEAEQALHFVGTPLHQQELLLLQAQLAYADGRLADADQTCRQLEQNSSRLSYRDQIKVQTLRNQLLILTGHQDKGTRNLRQLAEETSANNYLELASQIWQALATTLTDIHTHHTH